MSIGELVDSLATQVFTRDTVILMLPCFVASVFTAVIVHVIRLDNRSKNRPPFMPLRLLVLITVVGFVIGFLSQFFFRNFIEWTIPTIPPFSTITYMGAGFFTPLGAWAIHKAAMILGEKGWILTPQFAYSLKVKHVYPFHNVGNTPNEDVVSETELFYLDQKKGKAHETKPD